MDVAVFLIRNTAVMLLTVVHLAMFLRMLFSWLDPGMESRFSVFLFLITEPVIQPIRLLCHRMNWFQGVPFDIPFMIASVVILVGLLLLGA